MQAFYTCFMKFCLALNSYKIIINLVSEHFRSHPLYHMILQTAFRLVSWSADFRSKPSSATTIAPLLVGAITLINIAKPHLQGSCAEYIFLSTDPSSLSFPNIVPNR